jgi:hypothetical protein
MLITHAGAEGLESLANGHALLGGAMAENVDQDRLVGPWVVSGKA